MKGIDPEKVYCEMVEELCLYVIERDFGICQVTGKVGTEIHHIVYRSHGGEHKASNLVLLSNDAHYKEHSVKPLDPEIYRQAVKRNEKRLRRRLI